MHIIFPLDTDLVVTNNGHERTVPLLAGEPLKVQIIQEGAGGLYDLYLGGFDCAFAVPANFEVLAAA